MKRFIFLALVILVKVNVTAQNNWLQTAGGTSNDEALSIAKDNTGNVFTSGYFTKSAHFGTTVLNSSGMVDGFLTKQNTQGQFVWALKLGGIKIDKAYAVSCDNAGNAYVTGIFTNSINIGGTIITASNANQQMFIAKVGSGGNVLWAVNYSATVSIIPNDIQIDAAGNILIAGMFKGDVNFGGNSFSSQTNNGTPSGDVFILKLNSANGFLWAKQGAAQYEDKGVKITSDNSNNIYVTGQYSGNITFGSTYYNNSFNSCFVLKLSEFGNDVWFKRYTAQQIELKDIVCLNNKLYLCGSVKGPLVITPQQNLSQVNSSVFPNRMFVLAEDTSGTVLWDKTMGSNEYLSANGLDVSATEDVYVTGNFKLSFSELTAQYGAGAFLSVGKKDVYVAKISATGNWLWQKQFGGSQDDNVNALVLNNNSQPIIAGGYEKTFNVPSSANFITGAQNHDFTAQGPNPQLATCSESNYGKFISVESKGAKDIFISNAIDTLKKPYDFFHRADTVCQHNIVFGYIEQGDSIASCGSAMLSVNTLTGLPGLIGPDFSYQWSNGSTSATTQATSAGYYWVTVTAKEGYYSFTDTIYAAIVSPPANPIITSDLSAITPAIPLYSCFDKLFISNIDSTHLLGSAVPSGYSCSWITPSGALTNQTILALDTGYYSYTISSNQFPSCASSACVYLLDINFLNDTTGSGAGGGTFSLNDPYNLVFPDNVNPYTDTINVCEGGVVTIEMVDSILFANHIDTTYKFFADWTIDNHLAYQYYNSYPTTILSHKQVFKAVSSGICSLSVNILAPITNNVLEIVSKQFYLNVVPLPLVTAQINGPQSFCIGDTVTLTVSGTGTFIASGPNILSHTNSYDSLVVIADGSYDVSVSAIDTVYGCANGTTATFTFNPPSDPTITMLPANGIICPTDVVLLTAMVGSNYTWYNSAGVIVGNTQSISVSAEDQYFYTFNSSAGCFLTSVTVDVKQYTTPFLSAAPSDIVCFNAGVFINIETYDTTLINWHSPLNGQATQQFIQAPGIYICSVTYCNITTTDSIKIVAPIAPEIISSNNTVFCSGSNSQLNVVGNFTDVVWYPSGEIAPQMFLDSAGTYIATVFDENGCASSDTITISEHTAPLSPVLRDTTICAGFSVQLNYASTNNVNWYSLNDTSTFIIDSTAFTTLVLDSTTTYYVAIADSFCTSVLMPITINVNNVVSQPIILGDSIVCYGDTISLFCNITNALNYNWTGPNGFVSQQSTIIITPTDSLNNGVYTLFLSDSVCTGLPDSFSVSIRGNVMLHIATSKNNFCEGDSATITCNESVTNFLWQPLQQTSNNLTVSNDGVYFLHANDAYGCLQTSDSINIIVNDLPNSTLSFDSLVCEGAVININGTNINGATYSVSGPNSFSQTNNLASINNATSLNTGTYYLQTNLNGCVDIDTATIQVLTKPALSLGSDTVICEGTAITYSLPSGFDSYLWNNGSTTNVSDIGEDTLVYVSVGYSNICTAEDTVKITRVDCDFSNANVFSPNQNGINDGFYLARKGIQTLNIKIYNRWGLLVKEITEVDPVWDGTNHTGENLPSGQYTFRAEMINYFGEHKTKLGFVELFRN